MTDPSSAAPLSGLRVIDVSTYVAGPSAAMTLAQLGAEVIRVDPVGGAADTRRLPRAPSGTSLYWAGLNKAKRSVEIDLSSPEGQGLVGALVGVPGPEGGVLLTNTAGRPWLEYEAMRAYRDDLILVRIGGRADGRPALDYTVNCEVGLPLMTGPVGFDGPVNHVLPAWDLLTGLHAAMAVLVAERVRARTGAGQEIRVNLADVAVATMAQLGFVADVVVNGQGRRRDGNHLYGSFGCDFATADGPRVMIVALTERHWDKLVALTGIGDAVDALERSLHVDLSAEEERYQYRDVLEALIRPWFSTRTYAQVADGLDRANVLWGPYRTIDDLVNDPTSPLHVGNLMVDIDQPGVGTIPVPRSVLDFSRCDQRDPAPAPTLGRDTSTVLASLLGLGDSPLADLRRRGVIGG